MWGLDDNTTQDQEEVKGAKLPEVILILEAKISAIS
jgi:hypothetical protein